MIIKIGSARRIFVCRAKVVSLQETFQGDAPVIECMLNLLNQGPMSHTVLMTKNLGITAGSKGDRMRILKKYAFLFKTSKGGTNGVKYEIA